MKADSPVRRRVERPGRRALARTPKQLTEQPTLFQPGGAGGMVVRPGRGDGRRRDLPSAMRPGVTDDPAEVTQAEHDEVDPLVRARARAIAARLSVPRPRASTTGRRSSGELTSVRYRGGSDDLDLDATLRVLAERPLPDEEDLIVRERVRPPRSVVLAVDVSGSMKGERIRTAAATVGALAAELEHDALGVLAFWSDAAVLLDVGRPVRPLEVLDRMLRVPARGLTNIAFPLQIAAQQLAGRPEREARTILLSDCVHNAGPDPRPFAARLPRLDVLLDTTGEKDVELGRELASLGRGAFRPVRTASDVAPALTAIFSA